MWPEESLKKVGKVSAYNFLCPYKVNTDQLLGIRLAKREIQDVNEFFTPRDRGVPRKVAVLFSQTNERHAFANGGGNHRLFDALVQALEYAHLPIDVIFEPQINETDRLNRYDVLTFAGIAAMDPVTRSRIDEWAAKGGSLVEFKEKVPTAEMVSAVLAAAAKKGVKPCCEMLDAIKDDGSAAASIEVTPARRGKLDAYMITSRAPTLPVVRFKPAPLPGGAKKPILVRLFTRPDDKSVAGADPRVLRAARISTCTAMFPMSLRNIRARRMSCGIRGLPRRRRLSSARRKSPARKRSARLASPFSTSIQTAWSSCGSTNSPTSRIRTSRFRGA